MKVRIIKAIFLFVILFTSATSVAQSFSVDNYKYEFKEDYTITVTGHNDNTVTELIIPKRVIYNNMFYPVTKVADKAFYQFKKLKTVELPDQITELGKSAFEYCFELEKIYLPTNLVKIGSRCFSYCYKLNKISFPQTVEEIGLCAFYHCNTLTEFTFPSKVKEISRSVLEKCNNIKIINIHKDITLINLDFAKYCKALRYIEVESGNTKYKDIDGALYNYAGDSLIVMPASNNIYTIDPGTKYILKYSFASHSGKPHLEIPASVISINEYAFIDYSEVESFNVDDNNQHFTSKDGAIYSKDMKTLMFYPKARKGEFNIDNNVTTQIGNYAFYECKGLTAIKLPESLTEIGFMTFSYCTKLTRIEFPKSLTTINYGAFSYSGLTSVTLPENVTLLDSECFMSCDKLESVNILSENLKVIPRYSFRYCYKLKDIKLSGSITDIENRAFASSWELETLKIPEGVKVLDGNIFEDCSALKTIYLPSTLEKMDSQCFKNLKSLSEIYLNKSGDMEVKEDILLSTPISNATLYVPQGTKTKYESLAPWSGFGNIVEHESLINTVKSVADNGKMSVVMNCGKMSINDYQAGETILVINSNGTIINSLKGNGETLEIDVTEKGLIIVKAGNEVIKVIN